MAATSDSGNSRATRYAAGGLGLIVFLLGVALLIYVFNAANSLLSAPAPTVPAVTPSPGASPGAAGSAAPSAAVDIGMSLADHVRRLLVLLVMCFAGSAIASLGIRLFFSARNAAAGLVPHAAPQHAAPPAPAPPNADPGE